jgi:hypothetical protein
MHEPLELLRKKLSKKFDHYVTGYVAKDLPTENPVGVVFEFFRFTTDVNYSTYKPNYGYETQNPYWIVFGFKTMFSNN